MLRDEQIEALEPHVPPYLVCPITQLIYLEPVTVFPSGHVYEEEVIETILKKAAEEKIEPLCPLSRDSITKHVPAWQIKSAVGDYLKNNENAVNQQYVREKPRQIQEEEKKNDKAVLQQIAKDEEIAKELYEQELKASERARLAHEETERTRQAYRQLLTAGQLIEQPASKVPSPKIALSYAETKQRDRLIDDVQNLIWALGFEQGPRPKGRIDKLALFVLAVIEQACLKPLPWQEIKVSNGPKNSDMKNILKAAMLALKEMNPVYLDNAKADYAGQYDIVKTMLAGERSLGNSDYASTIGQWMKTVTDQPGDLVNKMIIKVDLFLQEKCVNKNTNSSRFKK